MFIAFYEAAQRNLLTKYVWSHINFVYYYYYWRLQSIFEIFLRGRCTQSDCYNTYAIHFQMVLTRVCTMSIRSFLSFFTQLYTFSLASCIACFCRMSSAMKVPVRPMPALYPPPPKKRTFNINLQFKQYEVMITDLTYC